MLIKLKTHESAVTDNELERTVKIKRANDSVILPAYYSDGAAGMDVHANEECRIDRGETKLVGTGLFMEIPPGYEIQVRPRSGLALQGIVVGNAPGTIDSDYRGELKVIVHNRNPHFDYMLIKKGDRIAQIVLKQVYRIVWQEEDQ